MNSRRIIGNGSSPSWLSRQTARLVGVVLSPRRTLLKAAFEPDYWVPILIVAAALFSLRLIMIPDLRKQYASPEFREWYIERLGVSEEKAPGDIEKMIKYAPFMALFEAPLIVTVGVGGVAIILHLLGWLKYKSTQRFKVVFSMTAWASVVGALPLFLSVPLKIVDIDWALPTNPSLLFAPELVGSFLHKVLAALDVFMLWQAWLLSLGISMLYRITVQSAVSSVGTIYVVFAMLNGFLSSQP